MKIAEGEMTRSCALVMPSNLHLRLKLVSIYRGENLSEICSRAAAIGIKELERRCKRDDPKWRRTISESIRRHPLPKRTLDDKSRGGFVYLLSSERGDHFKIGGSRNVNQRLKMFGVLLPFELELVHAIAVENIRASERAAHAIFAEHRVRGEWFDLSPKDVRKFKRMTEADLLPADVRKEGEAA